MEISYLTDKIRPRVRPRSEYGNRAESQAVKQDMPFDDDLSSDDEPHSPWPTRQSLKALGMCSRCCAPSVCSLAPSPSPGLLLRSVRCLDAPVSKSLVRSVACSVAMAKHAQTFARHATRCATQHAASPQIKTVVSSGGFPLGTRSPLVVLIQDSQSCRF